jgi:hypothetical protein
VKPYAYTDGSGDELVIASPVDCDVAVLSAAEVCVDPLHIPEIAAKMYEACGQQPPVMLGRPDIPESDPWCPWPGSSLSAIAAGRQVRQMWLNGPSLSMAPAQARQYAALADRADAEPDPADVDDLAAVIRHELYPGSERTGLRPSGSDRTAARAALRWMRDREAGRG